MQNHDTVSRRRQGATYAETHHHHRTCTIIVAAVGHGYALRTNGADADGAALGLGQRVAGAAIGAVIAAAAVIHHHLAVRAPAVKSVSAFGMNDALRVYSCTQVESVRSSLDVRLFMLTTCPYLGTFAEEVKCVAAVYTDQVLLSETKLYQFAG